MADAIKMVDLQAQHDPIRRELKQAMEQVLTRGDFIQGEAVRLFEEALAAFTGSQFAVGCGNGTDALQLALMALDLPPGTEVIIPAFNYVAAVEVTALLGLRPVLADVDPATYNLTAKTAAAQLTNRSAVLLPAHLFGQCADLNGLLALAKSNNLILIEDNAQSLGARCRLNKKSLLGGAIGHIGTTSFFPTKMLGGMGDGGAVLTSDPELARRVRVLASHGQEKRYTFSRIGINSRLDTLQAALLRVKLPYVTQDIQARQRVARWYQEALSGLEPVRLPVASLDQEHVYNQFTLRVPAKERLSLQQYLQAAGIPTAIYYHLPIHLQPAYRYLGYQEGDFPVAEQLSREVLSLPMHPTLRQDQVSFIADKIRDFFC